MKLGTTLALSTALVAGISVTGSALGLNPLTSGWSRQPAAPTGVVRRSVVKVHTGHGVITLPGSADSWEAADNAVFVADSIADVQIVNNEIPWRISYQ
jgi:hypothetical protein